MDVQTITMPQQEAREKLREYRRGLHRRADAEWERAAQAYEVAAEGKPLLVLSEVIASAPRDAFQRPRLAIARADQRQVYYQRGRRWRLERFRIPAAHHRLRDQMIDVPLVGDGPPFTRCHRWSEDSCEGYALLPIVPPDVRGRRDLSRHFILWEVETWANEPIAAGPDRDPYLLERVADDLFAVVGEWDLTDIERAVMRGRARQ